MLENQQFYNESIKLHVLYIQIVQYLKNIVSTKQGSNMYILNMKIAQPIRNILKKVWQIFCSNSILGLINFDIIF